MPGIKLLLDEDVWVGLAEALRQAGYDTVTVTDLKRRGLSDVEQLAFAANAGRAIITHNVQDFAPLAMHYFEQERPHAGIIAARQMEKGQLLRRTLALLETVTPETLANTLRFV